MNKRDASLKVLQSNRRCSRYADLNVPSITVRAVIPLPGNQSTGARDQGRFAWPSSWKSVPVALPFPLFARLAESAALGQDLQLDFRSGLGVATASAVDLFDIRVEVVVVVHQDACLLDDCSFGLQVQVLKLDRRIPATWAWPHGIG